MAKLWGQARRREEEMKRRQDLENQADMWAKSIQLREYIDAVEIANSNKPLSEESREQLVKWLSWAREHADRIDPLKTHAPFEDNSQ